MLRYISRRILMMIPVLFIVATATFFLIRLAPGGPFDQERAIPADILKNINAKYHLDKPVYEQYYRYMRDLILHGDLGPSFRYANRTVNEIIFTTFPVSLKLGLLGLAFALVIGIFSGVMAASKPNSLRDYIPMSLSMLGVCLPSFVIGPLFMLFFAIKLGWFNVSGLYEFSDYILPALTLGTMYAAYVSRLTRAGMLDVMGQDFVRTAKAKGLKGSRILWRHTLKGGLLPVVSFLGPAAAAMLTGSLVVEMIFNIPGLGRFFVQSALNRDYTLVMGTVLFLAAIILVLNLIVDILYAFLDPRVTYD